MRFDGLVLLLGPNFSSTIGKRKIIALPFDFKANQKG